MCDTGIDSGWPEIGTDSSDKRRELVLHSFDAKFGTWLLPSYVDRIPHNKVALKGGKALLSDCV